MRINQVFEDTIYDWVKMIHPTITVIWDKQDDPRPTTDYILLNIITAGNPESMAMPYPKNPATTATVQYQTFENITVSVNVYSQDGYLDKMVKLQRSINFDTVKQFLKTKGLAIRKSNNILDLTEMVDTAYEYRCQCDFVFCYSTTTDINVYPISRIKGQVLGSTFDITGGV